MALHVKRVYEDPETSDGERILVDRIWPRGISKDKARLSNWRKDLAPSNDLREWFGHEPDRWEEFKERYRAELEERARWATYVTSQRGPGRRTSRSFSAPRTQNTTTPGLWKLLSGRSSISFGQGKALMSGTGRGLMLWNRNGVDQRCGSKEERRWL
jgi:uncharacterized protein YeaO (DUF488 family)